MIAVGRVPRSLLVHLPAFASGEDRLWWSRRRGQHGAGAIGQAGGRRCSGEGAPRGFSCSRNLPSASGFCHRTGGHLSTPVRNLDPISAPRRGVFLLRSVELTPAPSLLSLQPARRRFPPICFSPRAPVRMMTAPRFPQAVGQSSWPRGTSHQIRCWCDGLATEAPVSVFPHLPVLPWPHAPLRGVFLSPLRGVFLCVCPR
jgi:hypothetical protein